MAITSIINREDYQGDGVTRDWPITFPVLTAGVNEFDVYHIEADGTETLLLANYEVDLVAPKVTFPTIVSGLPVLTTAENIVILRVLDLFQEIDFKNQGTVPAETIEDGLDRLTMMIQQLNETLGRAVIISVSDTTTPAEYLQFLFDAITDAQTAQAAAEAAQVGAELAETNASASEIAAAASAASAAADAIATAADLVQTALDVVATNADVLLTAADRVQTGLDATSTAADVVQTGLDATSTAADVVQTGLDATSTAADVVQTGLDATATAADAISTAADAVAAAASAAAAAASAALFPAIIGGDAGKHIIVNPGETGFILQTPAGGATTFVALTDVPANYSGAGLQAVRVNAGENALEFYTPAGGGATLDHDVTQANAFSVGEWVYHNGTTWELADASVLASAESIGVVTAATGADFTVQFGGRVTGLSGLTVGEAHFLSGTVPGAITATAPSTEGHTIKPVLIADSTTTGFVFNMRGITVTTTESFFKVFTDADAPVVSVEHNLGHKYAVVQVFNNSDKMVMPDDITLVDDDNLTVDLTSFGTLTGQWRIVVLDSGLVSTNTNTASTIPIGIGAGLVVAVNHNLNTLYPIVQVYDENGDVIQPDDITSTDANNTSIDLTSYGTRAGTYQAVVLAGGSIALSSATDLVIAGQVSGDRLVFDGSNWARKPSIIFHASGSTQTNFPTGTTRVEFPSETYDVGGGFDNVADEFVAPVTGYYHFDMMLRITNMPIAASACSMQMIGPALSNSNVIDPNFTADLTGAYTFILSQIIFMTVGQTVHMNYEQTGGGAQADVSSSIFSGHLIA